jgi:hypothetical protein
LDRTQRLALAGLAVLGAAVVLQRIPLLATGLQDDGYIYFRIAENAARGLGPVFTPGERVDAATSPVWMWLLAGAARLGLPLPWSAGALGLICIVGAAVLCGRWAIELGAPRRPPALAVTLAAPALLVADLRFQLYGFSGMETALTALVWLWATRALARTWITHQPERFAAPAALAALLVRPEFAVLLVGLAAVALAGRRAPGRRVARTLLPVGLGLLLYLAAHALYFGTFLPNTYHAKRASDWAHARLGLAYLAELPRTYPWLLAGLLALLLPRLRMVALAVTLGTALLAVHVVRLGGDHFIFHRPFVPVLPLSLALLGAAAGRLWERGGAAVRAATAAVLVLMLGLAGRQRLQPGAFEWVRAAAQLGHVLARTYPPQTRLGLVAIGATGYTSKLPVVDALGIADRHVARRDLSHEHVCALDIGHERGDPPYVLERADVVVPFAAYAPVPFENLDEIREGFYSQRKLLAAARPLLRSGSWRLRNLELGPGAYWAVLEKVRPRLEGGP